MAKGYAELRLFYKRLRQVAARPNAFDSRWGRQHSRGLSPSRTRRNRGAASPFALLLLFLLTVLISFFFFLACDRSREGRAPDPVDKATLRYCDAVPFIQSRICAVTVGPYSCVVVVSRTTSDVLTETSSLWCERRHEAQP